MSVERYRGDPLYPGIVRAVEGRPGNGSGEGEGAPGLDPLSLPEELVGEIARAQEILREGALDSGLRTGTAVRLSTLFHFLLGRLPLDLFVPEEKDPAGPSSLADSALAALTAAIEELGRPIDAIKHQAKTVTVGISRLPAPRAEGALWSLIRELRLPAGDLSEGHRAFLTAFEPFVTRVEGATLYRVAGLDALGRPRTGSTIRVLSKTGAAAGIPSRSEGERPLLGTKWGVARSREIYLGRGQIDGRRILILPLFGERPEGHILLYHIAFVEGGDRAARLRALAAHRSRLEALRIAVSERCMEWDPALIDGLGNETLFLAPPEEVAGEIAARARGE